VPDVESSHVSRLLRVLEALATGPTSAARLAAQLDAHPRTVRRLLQRLAEEGYAEPVPDDRGSYVATIKVVELAGRVLERTDLVRLAFPYVARLRNATGEAAHFSVPGADGVLHLIQETGHSVVMVKPRLGEQVPYHATASGKVLLAWLPRLRDTVLGGPLPRFTEMTITEPARLRHELAEVRERGYAVDELENSVDLRCVAAPVFDHSGTAVGCVGISAPALRMSAEQAREVAVHVVDTAQELSRTIGFVSLTAVVGRGDHR
jgi:DNA-binding IclR family transcriptional regulator